MADDKNFEKTSKTTVRRTREYADYSKEVVYDILDSGYLCTIAYVDDGKPNMNPTLFWRKDNHVYWHGSAANKMLTEQSHGIDVCFNVSHIDGLLLGKSAFHHSANYRSVTIFGVSEWVEEYDEKIEAAEHLIESFFPGRMNEVRAHKPKEINSVKILRLEIKEVSAKHRHDYSIMDILNRQKNDAISEYQEGMENPDCWTGLIPIRTVIGEATADPAANPNIEGPLYLTQSKFKSDFD